jgi:hypothetical protein
LLEEAVPIARDGESKGAQVVISRGGTTRLLERAGLTVPVIDIALSPYNMLAAIHEAQIFQKKSPSWNPSGSSGESRNSDGSWTSSWKFMKS